MNKDSSTVRAASEAREVITPKPQDEARRLQDKQDKERAAWEGMGPPVPEENEPKDKAQQKPATPKSGAV